MSTGEIYMGEPSSQELSNIEQRRFFDVPAVNYLGRIEFGDGAIDASDVSPEDFMGQIEYVKNNALVFTTDLRQGYGGCMDGRGNIMTAAGNPVPPRPKVIGGPSQFAWYVAKIGNFSVLEGVTDPLEQFKIVNMKLLEAGFQLGMHVECGAIRGVEPVLRKYGEEFQAIQGLVGSKARELSEMHGGILNDRLRSGIDGAHEIVSNNPSFNEENLLNIVRELNGDDAIIHLNSDHAHPTHGHEEDGLLFLRAKNAVAYKDLIINNTGRQLFIQNTPYAKSIVESLARTSEELASGIVIADQLPIAAVGVLGRNQHVGEITGHLLAA